MVRNLIDSLKHVIDIESTLSPSWWWLINRPIVYLLLIIIIIVIDCWLLLFQVSTLNVEIENLKSQNQSVEEARKKAEETIELERTKLEQQVL